MVGMIHQMQGQTPDARKAFERALQADPNAGVAANNLAWIHAENDGNLDLALQRRGPQGGAANQSEVEDTLGWVLVKRNELTPAIVALKRSVELDPTSTSATYTSPWPTKRPGTRPGRVRRCRPT